MDHKDVLNQILGWTCSNPVEGEPDEIRTMNLDLHCAVAHVKVRQLGPINKDESSFAYEILELSIE